MYTLLRPLLLWLLCSVASVHAEVVVVVHASSDISKLSHDNVVNIFMGRYRSLPDGNVAIPIDQPEGSALRAEFYRRLVNKNLNEINAYWARLVFSGRTTPPIQAASMAESMLILAGNRGGITYVDRSQVDKRMRVVMELPP